MARPVEGARANDLVGWNARSTARKIAGDETYRWDSWVRWLSERCARLSSMAPQRFARGSLPGRFFHHVLPARCGSSRPCFDPSVCLVYTQRCVHVIIGPALITARA